MRSQNNMRKKNKQTKPNKNHKKPKNTKKRKCSGILEECQMKGMVRSVVIVSLSLSGDHVFSCLPHNSSVFLLNQKLLVTVSVNSKLLPVLVFNREISPVAINCNSNTNVL